MENLIRQKFSEINLSDPFFDTLKTDYTEFSDWFARKANNEALVLYNKQGTISGFLYCKFEQGPGDDTVPLLPNSNHMKVGTFKFSPEQTRRGDRYLKKIFDYALAKNPSVDDIYVTVFGEKHKYLYNLFERYGFEKFAIKKTANGTEDVLLRSLKKLHNDVDKDYPFIHKVATKKYLLGIYPEFHTKLFPDSKLFTESPNIVRDISHSNSIHKIFLSGRAEVMDFQRGDVIVIYRTSDNQGPAEYRSVVTSLCVVENVHHINTYESENDFIKSCAKFSVFDEYELRNFYRSKKYPFIINFTYNAALPKRLIRKELIENVGLDRNERWNVLQLTESQFNKITDLSGIDVKFLVD